MLIWAWFPIRVIVFRDFTFVALAGDYGNDV